MKKLFCVLLALCLILAGCGSSEPPAEWEEGWIEVAPFLAAEPMEGYDFGESADTLGLGGVYYATWTSGEKRDFVNAEGESTVIFTSQIYVIAQEFRTEDDAAASLSQWMAREKQNYACGEETSVTVNGKTYTLLTLSSGSEGNPYGSGCAAFSTHGTNVICVELVCSDLFTANARAELELFLGGMHFSE